MNIEAGNGMYIINKEFKLLFFNEAVSDIYPGIEIGQPCYKYMGGGNDICAHCPLLSGNKQRIFNLDGQNTFIQSAEVVFPDKIKGYSISFSAVDGADLLSGGSGKASAGNHLKHGNNSAEKQIELLQNQLKDAIERAEDANRSKSAFLFNMSHDIRTPMNAILGFTRIGQRFVHNPEKTRSCFKKIEISGEHLMRMLGDVLDMARIESGDLTIEPKKCNLIEYFSELSDMVSNEMNRNQLSFIVNTKGIRDADVYCDTIHLNKVLLNLLNNAMKFNKPGGHVWLTARQKKGKDTDSVYLYISVKDDGIGMSENFLRKIFGKFEKERNSTESRRQGTGLGLAITKQIVEAAKGKINVSSQPGKGTEFLLGFKLPKAEKSESSNKNAKVSRADFTGRRVLLVEDNDMNREIAAELIGMTGITVDTTVNGLEAVEKIITNPEGYYDMVFLDIQMPVMDGYEAARQIRRLSRDDTKELPIVAMTANAFSEDVAMAKDAGMNYHIAKPIDMERLMNVLKYYL